MAISYTKVGWDTSKYVNPTNMNQMDSGIKAACDGVDTINGGTITGGTIALKSNLPQIISVYSGTPVQSDITFTMPSGFTPLFYFVYVSNSSGSSSGRSVLVLPVGGTSYFALNIGGTTGYIRLTSTVSTVEWLGGGGNNCYMQIVQAFGYYS